MLKPRIDDLKTMIFIIVAMFLLVFVSFVGAQTEFTIEDHKTATPTTTVVSYESLRKLIGTSDIYNNSITNDKLAEPVSIANGGTGKTTAAEALAALGTQPWTAGEKTQALNGSMSVDFVAQKITSFSRNESLVGDVDYGVIDVPVYQRFTAVASGVATLSLTITTPTAVTDNNGGGYTLVFEGFAANGLLSSSGGVAAAIPYSAVFTRLIREDATVGESSVVTTVYKGARATILPSSRDITDVVMTTAETNERVVTVLFTINCAGSVASIPTITGRYRLVYHGFTSAPILTIRTP